MNEELDYSTLKRLCQLKIGRLNKETQYNDTEDTYMKEEYDAEKGIDLTCSLGSQHYETYRNNNEKATEEYVVRTVLIKYYSDLTEILNDILFVNEYALRKKESKIIKIEDGKMTMTIGELKVTTECKYRNIITKTLTFGRTEFVLYEKMSEKIVKETDYERKY